MSGIERVDEYCIYSSPGLEEGKEGISQLIESQKYQKNKPPEWDKPDPLEKDFYQRWFERQQGKEAFDQILMSHSAHHANFIDPKFYVSVNEAIAPYSIVDSIHVCSSCLEFFNILGNQWSTKYVVPCIGAVQFAHLSKDQYFEARVYKNKDIDRKFALLRKMFHVYGYIKHYEDGSD